MKLFNRLSLSLATLLLVGGLSLRAPAFADNGTDNTDSQNTTIHKHLRTTAGDSSSSSGSSSNDSQGSDSTDSSSGDSNSTDSTDQANSLKAEREGHNLAEQFRKMGSLDIQGLRQHLKHHTEQERQAACTQRKANIATRMQRIVTRAQNHKTFFDAVYVKVKTFHDNQSLTVASYDTLTAAVDTAQANAAASISALQSLDISVDCTSQTVGSTVSAFQQAVKATRDSLDQYRTTLIALIKAVKTAAEATSNAQ